MHISITETVPVSTAREFWEFYRQYVHSAIHAASAAALTIFGVLVFVDPLFAALAIAAYVCPPLVLYLLGVDVGASPGEPTSMPTTTPESDRTLSDGDTDSDSDSDGNDGDSDSDNGDSDSDSDSDS